MAAVVLVLVLHGLIREEITQTLDRVVMVLVEVVLQVTVEVDSGVLVVQDSLEMDPRTLEPHHLNDQDLSLMDQGQVVVQTVGVVHTGAVLEAVAVLVLLAVEQEDTLVVVLETGHLN